MSLSIFLSLRIQKNDLSLDMQLLVYLVALHVYIRVFASTITTSELRTFFANSANTIFIFWRYNEKYWIIYSFLACIYFYGVLLCLLFLSSYAASITSLQWITINIFLQASIVLADVPFRRLLSGVQSDGKTGEPRTGNRMLIL